MAVQDTDLLLVQRGAVPYREAASALSTKIRGDIDVTKGGDIPIATASQLGVIRVGTNLQIDGDGILDAVIPAGLEYQGTWTDATASPTTGGLAAGEFWVWTGGDNVTLTGASWSAIQNEEVSNRDRVIWSAANNWAIVRDSGGGGGGGVVAVTGTAPIAVAGTADTPDVSITAASGSADGSMSKEHWAKLEGIQAGAEVNVLTTQGYTPASTNGTLTLQPGGDTTTLPAATTSEAGLMSAADKTTLDSLVSTPGGVSSITARNGITNNGTAGAPILDLDFGGTVADPSTATVMPYDITQLGTLP